MLFGLSFKLKQMKCGVLFQTNCLTRFEVAPIRENNSLKDANRKSQLIIKIKELKIIQFQSNVDWIIKYT